MAQFFGTDGATSAGAPFNPFCPQEVENVYWSGHPPEPGGVSFEALDLMTPEIVDLRNRGFADGVPEEYDRRGLSKQFCLFAPDLRQRQRLRRARRRLAVTARLTPEPVFGRGPIGGWTRITGSFPFTPRHRAAHLSRVVADPDYRGMGGFGMTAAGACLWAAARGCNAIRLVCGKDEPGAYYGRLGFDLVRENVLIQVKKGLVVLVDAYELIMTKDAMARLREEYEMRMAEFKNAILRALIGWLRTARELMCKERTEPRAAVAAPCGAIAM